MAKLHIKYQNAPTGRSAKRRGFESLSPLDLSFARWTSREFPDTIPARDIFLLNPMKEIIFDIILFIALLASFWLVPIVDREKKERIKQYQDEDTRKDQ